jgi:hypothetical protein
VNDACEHRPIFVFSVRRFGRRDSTDPVAPALKDFSYLFRRLSSSKAILLLHYLSILEEYFTSRIQLWHKQYCWQVYSLLTLLPSPTLFLVLPRDDAIKPLQQEVESSVYLTKSERSILFERPSSIYEFSVETKSLASRTYLLR